MFGYYQFKDDKYYNKAIGSGSGLSIFPYKGLYNAIPYSRPIAIRRGRYSRTRLTENNPDYTNIFGNNIETQEMKGPLPYIYKVRVSGLTSNFPCASSICAALNDKDFYLHGITENLNGIGTAQAVWANTFTDVSNPNGFFLEGGPSNSNSTSDVFDLLVLTLIESADTDTDTSYFVLSLGSSMSGGTPQITDFNPLYPMFFLKTFAKGEGIFALEETITLTPATSITIDNGVFGTQKYGVHEGVKYCNFSSASAILTPYQTETYDIRNNNNAYADLDNLGLLNDVYPTVPVQTSSGVIDVDKFYATAARPRILNTPEAFLVTFSGVSTKQQGDHVECGEFFNRSFKLKNRGSTPVVTNFLIDREQLTGMYLWDNETEREHAGQMANYIGLHTYTSEFFAGNADPYLDNIGLVIAGSGGYLRLSLYRDTLFGGQTLNFQHTYNPTIPLRSTTFNSWSFISDNSSLSNTYCDFSGVQITLEPVATAFHQAKLELSCAPLCSNNTIPINANINVRISGYFLNGYTDGRVPFDETIDVITSVESSFFNNDDEGLFTPEGYGGFLNSHLHFDNNLTYGCSNTSTEASLGVQGRWAIPPIEKKFYHATFSGSGLVTVYIHAFTVRYTTDYAWNGSGCPVRYNCDDGISFKYYATENISISGYGFNGAFEPTLIRQAAISGVINFDGFL